MHTTIRPHDARVSALSKQYSVRKILRALHKHLLLHGRLETLQQQMQRDVVINPVRTQLKLHLLELGNVRRHTSVLPQREQLAAQLHLAIDVAEMRLHLVHEHVQRQRVEN